MKRILTNFLLSAAFSLLLAAVTAAQSQSFNDVNVPFTFDVPGAPWKQTVRPTASNQEVEFVYGDRRDGHLEIRRLTISAGELLSDVISREQEQKLQFLPDFAPGREENFAGALKGKVYNFEFVRSSRPMSGRYYFLKSDETTVYVLRFTGERDKLKSIRNHTDLIARTFKIKAVEKEN